MTAYWVPAVDPATKRFRSDVEDALATAVVAPAAAAAAAGVAAGKADTANPTFTGTVTVPTPSATGAAANKGYVDTAAASKVDENALIFNAKKAGTGIKGDRMAVFTGAMASGSAALTISGVSFTSADVGKAVIVAGAGAAGATLRTTIATFVSSTQVTLAASASTTVSAKYTAWGTDDTAALQAAIDAMTSTSSNVVRGGEVLIPQKSRCMITGTVYVRRVGGRLKGVGFSDWSSGYSALPYGSMLIWDGPAGQPMFQVEAAKFFRFEGLSLIGNPLADCRPSALLRLYTPDGSTTNGQVTIDNCIIGRVASYGGFAGTNAERVADAGIIMDGTNVMNDRFRIVGGRIEGCVTGLSLPNSQSVLGSVDGTTFFRNDTHVATSAQVHIRSVYFGNAAVRDLDIASTARVRVSDVGSEISAQFARMRGASTLIVEGGYFQCTSSLNIDKWIIDAVDNTRQSIRLKDLQIDSATGWTVTTAPILVRAHAATNSSLSNKQVHLDGVRYPNSTNIGITPSFFDVTPVGTAESVTVWGHVQPAGGGNQNEGVEQSFYNILRSPSDALNFDRDDRLPVSLAECLGWVIHSGPRTKAGVIATLDKAEARGKATVAYFPGGPNYDLDSGLSLNNYSCQIRGAGAGMLNSTTPAGTVFYASTQAGPVLDFKGWKAPAEFSGKVRHGDFVVRGSGVADATKANIGIRIDFCQSTTFSDIAVLDTGGPGVKLTADTAGQAVYLCDFERIVIRTPVSAKTNDVPYFHSIEANGNRFRSFGLISRASSADVGVSGAVVIEGTATWPSSTNLFDAWWLENLHVPTNGCLVSLSAIKTKISGFQYFDTKKESGATGTYHVKVLAALTSNHGGNVIEGVIPGDNGATSTDIDGGVYIAQSYNRVEGTKGYKGKNVTLASGVGYTFVHLRGSISGATDQAWVDSSGQTTNRLIDDVAKVDLKYGRYAEDSVDMPSAGAAQTFDRRMAQTSSAAASGRLVMSAIYLRAGQLVSSITFCAGSTALAGGTHGWFALFDGSRNLLGQSADDAAITWAASTKKTYSLSTPVTVATTGWHYVGYCVSATTMPTIVGVGSTGMTVEAPVIGGLSTSGLTDTAPSPAAAITGSAYPYAYVS